MKRLMPPSASMHGRRKRGTPTKRVIAAAILAWLGAAASCSYAQTEASKVQADQELVESLYKRLPKCFTTIGVRGKFPQAAKLPADAVQIIVDPLPAFGPAVSDGYSYWIALSQSRRHVYVRQVGGFGGTRILFGPLDVDMACD